MMFLLNWVIFWSFHQPIIFGVVPHPSRKLAEAVSCLEDYPSVVVRITPTCQLFRPCGRGSTTRSLWDLLTMVINHYLGETIKSTYGLSNGQRWWDNTSSRKKSAGNRGQEREVCGPPNFQEVIYRVCHNHLKQP